MISMMFRVMGADGHHGLLNYGCNYDFYDSFNSTHSMISFNWDLASSNGGIYE